MLLDLYIERALFAAAVVLLLIGAATAWRSAHAAKRLAGLLIAEIGALLALAALHAPEAALIAGVAAAFAQLALGASILVRLQEAYGGVESPDIDAADEDSEPAEPAA